jgi:F0F1-type ATP synthase delta subunit
MKPTASQYAQAFLALYRETPAPERERVSRGFFELLRRRKETKKLPSIMKRLERLMEEQDGVKRVRSVSAYPLDKKELEEIAEQAQRIFQAEKVVLEPTVNPEARGGIVLRTETEMADLSVKGKMEGLRSVLLK